MEGPRAPHEGEFPTIVKFLDENLRPGQDWSITNEYPVALSPTNLGNIRIIKSEDQVLSHAVMRPMIVKTPAGLFKVAGIGSVVTSTEHRNQGLSSQIIESCLEAARGDGCDFAILWTNLHDFYRKLGFELGGSEINLTIERELPVDTEGFKILESARVAPEAIHRLYMQHTVSSMRTLEETRKYLQIPNMRVYTAWDTHGVLKSYAIEGKGADLNGYVHEWGGSVSALLPLFAHIRTTQKRPVTVIAPSHASNLIRQLTQLGVRETRGYLGMIKILNSANLFGKVKRFARGLGIQDLTLEKRDVFYFGVKDAIFKTDSEIDMVRLVFGPTRASELHDFDPATRDVLEKVLPVNMWLWGWDSI